MLGRSSDTPPRGLRWRSHTLFITTTVGMGAFTDLFLYGLIVPVLPFLLKDRVDMPESQVQGSISMLLAVYAAASCATSPVAGVLADKFASSRQLPFTISLGLLAAATVMFAWGRSIAVLVVARVLQGASAGVVWTVGLAIIVETVGQENLGKTMGTIFSFISVAGLFSPICGGLLYAKTGYNGVFGVGIGLVAIDFILRMLMIEKKVRDKYLSDSNTSTDSTNGDEGTEQTPLLPDSSTPHIDERYRLTPPKNRITRELPILLLLLDPGLLTAILIAFMQAALLGSFDATVPLVAESAFAFNSLRAGLLFLPLGCADFLLGPVFGWAVDRYGPRSALRARLDNGQLVAVYAGVLALNGAGLAAIGSPSIVEAGRLVENYARANPGVFSEGAPWAQLYGINSMVFSGGLTVGPLVAGALRERIGYGNMNAVLAGVCVLTAVLAALFIGRKEGKGDQDE
ncbi:major facilitator superfamily domain-containing protein [Boeremia exigua]|uniref:major facilitator superfamily domain-containing protein n=1 Tax=Boeremia exigua TaxID=749465 RepID=UPI001E8ED3D3|nr:major facilitator superfamily domain-containing protein [Boeremia exigua]KAH6614006.1 major facilitator superfamily domain-containing protein [Boeremia exigua]